MSDVPEIDVVRTPGSPEWFLDDGHIHVKIPGEILGLVGVLEAGTDLRTLELELQRAAGTLRHTMRQIERLRQADIDLGTGDERASAKYDTGDVELGEDPLRTDGGSTVRERCRVCLRPATVCSAGVCDNCHELAEEYADDTYAVERFIEQNRSYLEGNPTEFARGYNACLGRLEHFVSYQREGSK